MNELGTLLSSLKLPDKARTRAARWLNLSLVLTIGILVILTLSLAMSQFDPATKQELLVVLLALMVLFGGAWAFMHLSFARAELAQAKQQLATEILERQQDEITLRLAKENAEAATRSKSEFLANMSHEIRTPMNGVVSMTSLLQATNLSEEQRFFINTIRHSSDTLLTIINDILDLSKAESGRLGIEHNPLNLHRSVEEVLDLLAPKAAEKDLELVYSIHRSVPITVQSDATRLRQVLLNIVSNAIKFTHRGDISVVVDANMLDDQQVELHFAIRDTGIGIAPAHREHLFQPFSQADASNTRNYGGTGLGLAISKRLCELMGGSIWVESEEHIGSIFHFTIIAPIVAPLTPQDAAAEGTDIDNSAFQRRSALIVDDNPMVRQIIQQTIGEWGMVSTQTASGADALALVRRQMHFDIAIIDMQMPGMSGLILAKELRKIAADMPIVMTSSLGVPMYAAANSRFLHDMPIMISPTQGANEQRESVRQLGVRSIIFKPVKPSVLRAALLEHFDIAPTIELPEPSKNLKVEESIDANMGQRHPLHILIAEDNITNQKVALRMLDRLGYQADVAVNGMEAVKALQEQKYDVVLMDIQMPEMDGLEATRKIRTDLAASDQPYIIAMTAAVMQVDRQKCLEAGMDDFLAKPARLEELAQALQSYLPLSTRTR